MAHAFPPLQLFVDLTPTNGVLRPPPGTYSGPVVIQRAMTLEGDGKVTVDGGGQGTVLTIRADGVTLRGMRLTHSGSTYDGVDAGLLVEADGAVIEDNDVEGTLFGMHLKQANGNVVRGNRISSGPEDRNLRGDAIRLWYSNDNLIESNEVFHARDMLFTNSADNRIVGNQVTSSRVGMQFVFAPGNIVEGNYVDGNETGIIVLYSEGLTIRGNRLWNARHFSGAALALKESSEVVVEGNEIVHCAVGIQANAPTHPGEHPLSARQPLRLQRHRDVLLWREGRARRRGQHSREELRGRRGEPSDGLARQPVARQLLGQLCGLRPRR